MPTSPSNPAKKKKKLWVDEHTYLCFPTLDFTEELFAIIQGQRTYLEAFLPWVKNIHKPWHVNGFLKEAILLNRGKQQLTTLIIHKQQLAGSVSLLKRNHIHKRAEIGYWLRADLQGQGIMTKSCQQLIQYAFKELKINRLEMRMVVSNQKSRNIPLRLQFKLEGRLRSYQKSKKKDYFEDVEIFSLLKEEWEKK